jgi:primosomal protein N' (replication factor Y)
VSSDRPLVTEEQLRLAREMRRRYYCSTADALKAMVPPTVIAIKDRSVLAARLSDPDEAGELLDSGEFRSMKQVRVVELLLEHESASCMEIRQATGVSQSVISNLGKKGILTLFKQKVARQLPVEDVEPDQAPELTARQKEAVESIRQAGLASKVGELQELLLYGITGSGKTEVYLQAAEAVLNRGQQVLILVPEIALTPQMTRRLTSRFGSRVAILHSRLTPSERYESWQRVLAQEIPIVVGARSAVFAPLKKIGLIVIDEEQESSYKAEMKPRYYAPDIARLRAMMGGAVLVLGSATPQVSSFRRALEGPARLLRLPDRIGEQGLAPVEIVDMRREYAKGNLSVLSRRFLDLMEQTLGRGEQAMILLNRRGFSRTIVCRACGWQMRCPSCDIALTSHLNPYRQERTPARMVCHLCDRISPVPRLCPECGSQEIAAIGIGTQQLEETLMERFPAASILRMDQDTTRGRFSHRELLDTFESGAADILVGTQMIAKGHDFHNVTFSAILSADQLLGTGEFRALEQAFQLMTQTAGRAGRGGKQGRVIIQTLQPDHFVVTAAARQDYQAFYREEIVFRQRMGYLPFGHMGLVEFRGFDQDLTEEAAWSFHGLVSALMERHGDHFAQSSVTRPAPSPIARIRNRYRFRIVARDPSAENLTRLLFHAADRTKRTGKVSLTVDIDPWSTL